MTTTGYYTARQLAEKLGVSTQAVHQSKRWEKLREKRVKGAKCWKSTLVESMLRADRMTAELFGVRRNG